MNTLYQIAKIQLDKPKQIWGYLLKDGSVRLLDNVVFKGKILREKTTVV